MRLFEIALNNFLRDLLDIPQFFLRRNFCNSSTSLKDDHRSLEVDEALEEDLEKVNNLR